MAVATISVATLKTELADLFEARATALKQEFLKHEGTPQGEVYNLVATEFQRLASHIREGLRK